MAESELAWHVRRFPRALGALLVAPARALGEIEAAERGGVSAALIWSLLASVALRFPALADAVMRVEAGGGMRIVAELTGELVQAVPAVLVAALAIVALAGARRDPGLDLELGAGAVVPFLVVRSLFRAGVIVMGREPPPLATQASYVVAGGWALVLTLLAARIARRRGAAFSDPETGAAHPRRPPEPTAPAHRRATAAGVAALALLGGGLAAGARWTARNSGNLGTLGRGTAAPDFRLPRIDGDGQGDLALSDLRGKVVVLDFWATWCPPCLAMLPTLHQLAAELGPQGVTFVGVDSDGDQATREDVAAFVREHGAPYPVVYDNGRAGALYRVNVLPTLVIVGRDGAIDRVLIGQRSKRDLGEAIAAAAAR